MHQIDFVAPKIHQNIKTISKADQAVAAADRIGDYKASMLARTVADFHNLDVSELFHHSRSRAPIAATRQLAMYLMHVVLGRSLTQVGLFYGRDRTTVAYACIQIEDLRDDEVFESKVTQLEEKLELAFATLTTAKNEQSVGGANG